MKAIIIAAGKGSRIPKVSKKKPKCFIKINNVAIIDRQINLLKKNKIKNIFVITGYKANYFNKKKYTCIKNKNYSKNEQMASLMYAQKEFDDDIIVLFSDIIYDEIFLNNLIKFKKDNITLVCQKNWREKYKLRIDHPLNQADKVKIVKNRIVMIGKQINEKEANSEFIGMFFIPKKYCKKFINYYKKCKLPNKLQIHNFFSHFIDDNGIIKALNIKGNFMEIDTFNDYKIAKKIFF